MSIDLGFRLICISTDCVFSGRKGYYNEQDTPDPVDDYGESKLAGEITEGNCLTIRTSMIGREIASSHSLVEWFLASRGRKVNGFVNVIYSGFPTIVLAEILGDIIADHPELRGIYNVSSDPVSKFELLALINKHFDAQVDIAPDPSVVMDRSLDSSRFRSTTGFEPETWDAMIKKMAHDPTPYDEWRAHR
jgi:dTDP-4-dehydrorhamnose reductase